MWWRTRSASPRRRRARRSGPPARRRGAPAHLAGAGAGPAPPAPRPAGGSNAWAVAPYRSASGAALVAGDPHLLHAAPSPWYLVHLLAPDLEVAGAAYVGGPVVQVGRNRRGAWSLTNLTADNADLVVERLHPEDPERYACDPGEWAPLA